MSSHTGTFRHPSHCDNSGKRKTKKKGGVVGGKEKYNKSMKAENNGFKKKQRPHSVFLYMAPNYHYTETA